MKTKISELCPRAWATTLGVIFGVDWFLHVLIPSNGGSFLWYTPDNYAVIASYFPWISPTIGGAIVALVLGVIGGAILGGLVAVIHNYALKRWSCK